MDSWPAAIFFDFDGVIVDSELLHLNAFRRVLADENISLDQPEYFKELIGFDDRGAFRHMFQKHGRRLDDATFARVMERKKNAMLDILRQGQFDALPGVKELVRGLAKHYPLAICSGALRGEIEVMLKGIGLDDCFPVIVAAEDVSVGKPDPMGYLMTADLVRQRTGLEFLPEQCLIIEDAPSVIRSVKARGFKTLGVATSYPADQLNDADYVVGSLEPSEVLDMIPGLKVSV